MPTPGHRLVNRCSTIALNSTGTLLATGAEWKDNTAQLWDTRTGDPVGSPMRHVSDVLALAFDPTGGLLATGSASNTAQLWNARTGAAVGKPMEHTGPVTAVVFDRRGRFLASASGDNTARLWNAHTGDPIGKPMEHGGPVWAIAFDANGKLLATGSDNAARLWLTLSAQTLFERARAILGSETEPVRPSSSPALFIWIEKKWGP